MTACYTIQQYDIVGHRYIDIKTVSKEKIDDEFNKLYKAFLMKEIKAMEEGIINGEDSAYFRRMFSLYLDNRFTKDRQEPLFQIIQTNKLYEKQSEGNN